MKDKVFSTNKFHAGPFLGDLTEYVSYMEGQLRIVMHSNSELLYENIALKTKLDLLEKELHKFSKKETAE